MDDFQEQFYQVMTKLRANSRAAASTTTTTKLPEPRVWNMDNDGVIVSKPTNQGEPDRITKETIQTPDGPAVVTKYQRDQDR